MKTKTKIILSAISLGVTSIGAIVFLSWFNFGGMRSNYPAKDNDRKILRVAQTIVPIIQKVESYQSQTGRFPEKLEDLGVQPSQYPRVFYTPESNYYTLWIKLGWDPSLTFSSRDRSWTFDPGDGSPRKRIKLDIEQENAGDLVPRSQI